MVEKMNIFVGLIFFIITSYVIFGRYKIKNIEGIERKSIVPYIWIVSIALICISGLRGINVGIDTVGYYNSFNFKMTQSFFQIFEGAEKEYGYKLFEYFVGRIFGEFQILLLLVAIFSVGTVSYLINKYSSNYLLSYILFVGLGFFTFGMSTIRQTIAIGFTLIAYEFIQKKQLKSFLITVIIASMFHITAVIFLPSYWLNKFKLNKKTSIFFIVMATVFIVFKDVIRDVLLNSFTASEYSSVATGGNKFYLFLVFSLILGVIYRKSLLTENEHNKSLFFMIVAAVFIMPITQFNPAVMRLYYYYSIFLIVYIPNILNAIKDKGIFLLGIYGYTLISLIWFFSNIIPTSRLENYLFFWQL